MGELFDFKTRKPVVTEKPPTPEKSREESYFDTLKKKRDVLSSHYTLNQLREGRKVEEMSETEIEDYKSVKNEYDKRRELFLASFDGLNEDDNQTVAGLTSLTKVEIALSSLQKPAEAETQTQPKTEATPTPENVDQPVAETPVIKTPEEVVVVSPVEAENPDRGTTMDEVDRMLKYSQDTARPLETAYWESKKAELLEREEAEANPERPAPNGFMQRAREAFARAKDSIAKGYAQGREKARSFFSRENMEPVSPSTETAEPEQPEATQPEVAPQQSEKAPKKPSGWGWLKERGKGVWNFGIWEFHQAERFRSKTKEVANDTKGLATLIQQERNLGLEEAEKEAWETMEELKKNELDISAPEFYQANKDITERKRKENDQEIEYIIKSAGNDLVEKLAKYRGEAGQDVLTLENKAAFEADLRGELNKMRDGAMRKDFINFAKLMRRNLDENWHWRYVWGAAEAALGFAGVKFLVVKYEMMQAAKLAAAEKAAAGGIKGGAEKFLTEGMHKNVWTTLKEMAQKGPKHLNLDDKTLTDLSQKVLNNNNMYEPEWVKGVVNGLKSSRVLPEGLPIKIPLEVLKVLGY